VVASLHTGYDTGYLTKAVGTGADYYLGAKGEPPGYWQGAGARALGLSGPIGGLDDAGKASAEVMRRLYHEDIGPDGQVLGRRQRKANYPEAGGSLYKRVEEEVAFQRAERGRFFTPEEERALRLRLRSAYRTVVPLYDLTYSAPKSVSVLWASLLAASAEAEAEGREADAERLAERAAQVRGAVKRASDRMIAVAERELAYVRTGHHSKTSGEWRDAGGFIVASFEQHDSRDGSPQLHVHNAIANRAQRADGADDTWRALDAHPLFRNKLRLGTLGDRFCAQELELIGLLSVLREDGKALEVGGISDEAVEEFSTRSKELRDKARELEWAYEQKHGHAPGKQARWAIRQQAAVKTRNSKDHNPPPAGQQVAAWVSRAARSGIGKLSALHEAADEWSAEHEPHSVPGDAERARIIRKAVAATQMVNATFDRSQLTFELGQVLPPLPAGVDPEEYLNGLADEALSGRAEGVNVLQVSPAPDLINISRLPFRKDGGSIYRAPREERFCTAEHRDHEQYLVDVAILPVPQRVSAETAAAALAGTDLDYSQREACLGLLTSGRLINCLVAPAGTGKTHVMAAFARVWEQQRAGRVIGLTASTNAARVMADEARRAGARMETFNIAQFLGKIKDSDRTRGHVPVYPGDVLVVDEATQVSTEDALRIAQIARRNGAMVVGTFDPGQLGSVDAGGIFPLIAARHGSYRLTEVRRFTNAWEREASLRLRDGDVTALAEYAGRGRIYHGPQDRVFDDAVSLYLNGFLDGKEALLMATSNETAVRLSALVRERLAELGRVGEAEITLPDGNQAGRGDLIRARLNTRIDADGQTLANRDVVRVESINDSGSGRLAAVRRQTGPDQWSRPFHVPVAYLESDAELAYAGNVHVAEGATVDRGHTVIDAGATRSLVYTAGTRGREKNTFHVVTGPPDPAQPTRAERDAYTMAQLRRSAELRKAGRPDLAREVSLRMPDRPSDLQLAPWEAILAQALQQDEPERTALEVIQAAQDFTTHTGHLFQLRQAFWRLDVVPQIDEMVRQRIPAAEYERYLTDPARPAFLEALREHEIGGRRIEDVLDSITAEPLDGLRSIAAGLHGRAGKEPPPVRGETKTWAERTPGQASADIRAADRMADLRQAELGRQIAERPPPWALEAWGVPPAHQESAARRADWEKQAGIVGSYRELAGITNPAQAIGPPPAGQADLAEMFRASVRALQLPDEAALLKAMGRGQLEAARDEYDRAAALAPPDVQPQIDQRAAEWEDAQVSAHIAGGARDAGAQADAQARAQDADAALTRLAVADAARREWTEAHAGQAARAEAAERELRSRGLPERIPVTDAEVAKASAEPREMPVIDPAEAARWREAQAERNAETRERNRVLEPEVTGGRETPPMDPAVWARLKAERTAELDAYRQASAERMARLCPVTDAEIARYGAGAQAEAEAEPDSPERAAFEADLAELRAGVDRIGELVDQMPGRETDRRAEIDAEARNEPGIRPPEAEPELERAWQPGTDSARYAEPAPEMDAEPELEM
jgi:conjugative relaxase-like TrwC/TraI family protein